MENKPILLAQAAMEATYDGLASFFLIAFALTLGADNLAIGIIGATPFIATLLAEIPAVKLQEYFCRKTICVYATGISRVFWVGIIAAPFLLQRNPLVTIVMFYMLLRIIQYLCDPSWITLLADIISPKERGSFFGKMLRIVAVASTLTSVAGGFYLSSFPEETKLSFAVIFFVGMLFGLVSTYFIGKIKEPTYCDHVHHPLKEYLLLNGSFRKFALTSFFFHFAVMLASPFFAVYMLKDLGLTYAMFTIFNAISPLTKILFYGPIGRVYDRIGDKKLVTISTISTAIVPVIFMFITKETFWLLIPAQIIAGISWAGTEIGITNMLFGLSERKHRALQMAGYQILISIASIAGPILGGLLADNVTIMLTGIPLIFAISTILRLFAGTLFTRLAEPRKESTMKDVFREVVHLDILSEVSHPFVIAVKRITRWM